MNGSLRAVHAIVFLSFVGLVLSSCGGSQTTLSSNVSSGTTTTTPATSGTVGGQEEEANATIPSGYDAGDLFVTVPDTIDYLNFTSLTSSHSSRCTFTSASVVNDLTCVVEANELATFFGGIKLQMNVPANYCKYISTTPYWYYNHEVGYGPTAATISITKDGSGTVTSKSCSVGGSALQSCYSPSDSRFNDVTFDTSDETNIICNYDTSAVEDGQNCCFGKYDLTRIETTPDGSTTTVERGKSWGGNVRSCIGGAGRTDWETYNAAGYPVTLIEKMEPNKARTKIITVKGPIESIAGYPSNIPVANFFSGSIHTHSGFGTASGVTSTATAYLPARPSPLPYYVDPISDRSGTLITPGNPYYDFRCLDEAFEANFRIRVMVQEWDTVAALENYITTGVSSTVGADEPGTAPADCPGQAGEACNQVQDADDLLNANGGTWSNASPSLRGNYFPKHPYAQ